MYCFPNKAGDRFLLIVRIIDANEAFVNALNPVGAGLPRSPPIDRRESSLLEWPGLADKEV
jgi:hypothetical protein